MKMIMACLRAILLLLALSATTASAPNTPPSKGWGTAEMNGIHWLVTPEGKRFYSKGVNNVHGGKASGKSLMKQEYHWRNFYSSKKEWRRQTGSRLTEWGFNTRGGWSDASPEIDLTLMVDLDLGRNSKFHWFDPFDPAMEQKVLETAKILTAPYRNDPRLIGYFSDNEVGWWNSALFKWFMEKGWQNHTKQALWQLFYDTYGGNWDRLLQDWVPDANIRGFDDLKRAGVKMKLRQGGHGIRLVNRFMYITARQYYRLMYRGIRHAHPGALILGDRYPLYYHQDAVLALGDFIDVISTNYNVDTPDGWVAPYYFEGLRQLTGKPVLVTEFFFAAEENRSGNRNEKARSANPKSGHLMTVQTQEERARGLSNALRNFARFPNVVGVHWFQYCDEPLGGREDGEDYNMGLIDIANRPYEQVTEAFARLNPQLEGIHEQGSSGSPAAEVRAAGAYGPHQASAALKADGSHQAQSVAPSSIFKAARPISVTDQSLVDWEKEETRLKGFQAPQPYVPFGDVHLAWGPEGLYLASIANTYVDTALLAYEGEFPASEAYQIHLFVEADGRKNHYSLHLAPRVNPRYPDGFEIKTQLFRHKDDGSAERLPVEGRVQRLEKSLPHMLVEGFFPAEWLGVKELHTDMKIRMNVVLVSFYRELTMSWSGVPALEDAKNHLKTVVLKDSERQRASATGMRQ